MFLHYFNWHTQWLVCTTKSILCIGLKLIDGITFQSIVWEEWRLKILRMQPFKSKVCVWYYLKHYGTFWVKMCKNVVKFQAWKIVLKSQQIIASRELEIVNIFSTFLLPILAIVCLSVIRSYFHFSAFQQFHTGMYEHFVNTMYEYLPLINKHIFSSMWTDCNLVFFRLQR